MYPFCGMDANKGFEGRHYHRKHKVLAYHIQSFE